MCMFLLVHSPSTIRHSTLKTALTQASPISPVTTGSPALFSGLFASSKNREKVEKWTCASGYSLRSFAKPSAGSCPLGPELSPDQSALDLPSLAPALVNTSKSSLA